MSAIVMLHGWGMNPAVFSGLSSLLHQGHEVLAPALPGYDGTEGGRGLDHLAAILAARAPAQCCVAGWSLGALVALAWAQARPDQVERLVLMGATPCFVRRDDWPAAMPVATFDAFGESLRADPAGALRRFVTLQVEGDRAAKRVAGALRTALAASPEPSLAALEGGLRILRETDLRGTLQSVSARALVVHGERDPLVPRDAAAYLAAMLPRARLTIVPRAAHAPFVSDAQRVSLRILEFLDER